jgi:DNA-binding CsgD family transcriptional regulator
LETWALAVTPGLLERGAEIEAGLDEPMLFIESPTFMLIVKLVDTGELDRARLMLEGFIRSAMERGDEHTRQWTILQLITVEGHAGRFDRALDYAAEARAIAEQTHETQYRGMVEQFAAPVEADIGLVEQARRSAEEGLRCARSVSDEVYTLGNLAGLGHLELVVGDMTAAADYLRELPERIARTGHLSSHENFSADAIEALIGVGELDSARACLADFLEIAPRLSPGKRVGAWRSAGLVAAAEGDRARAIDAFERALAADDPPAYPLERARTLLVMGAVQRQALQRRAARETLETALAMFEGLRARPWVEKARDELARVSGRRAASGELTDAERRVAQLAAEGRHNKEIAAELFLSVGTVERHLTSVYRKLDVRSRAELAGRFSRAREDASQ